MGQGSAGSNRARSAPNRETRHGTALPPAHHARAAAPISADVAVFSMGGYVAGPPVMAALLRRMPVVVMEPNAIPGFTNRVIGRFVYARADHFPRNRALTSRGRTEVTGLPVREEFFRIPPKPRGDVLNVLITGGSQGSRTLNRRRAQSWPLFRKSGIPCPHRPPDRRATIIEELRAAFAESGLDGEVVPFIHGHAGGLRRRRSDRLPLRRGRRFGTGGGRQAVDPGAVPLRRRRSSDPQRRSHGAGRRRPPGPRRRR